MQPVLPAAAPPPQGDPAAQPPPSTDPKAIAAFVLGVFGVLGTFCGMGVLLGIPAMVLGAVAHRDIGRSAGGLLGRGLATAGMILGTIGSLLFFAWASTVAFLLMSSPVAASAPLEVDDSPIPTWPSNTPLVPSDETARAHGVRLHRSGGALRVQLARQASSARSAGEIVLVETLGANCGACEEIDLAMRDPELQAALFNVRLVDVDTGEFHPELGRLRMDEVAAPWFYLIDSQGEPRDAIGADEWDDNVAGNIAPVLHAFVHGKLRTRRHAWHGGATL
jgi:hypothetical protein